MRNEQLKKDSSRWGQTVTPGHNEPNAYKQALLLQKPKLTSGEEENVI